LHSRYATPVFALYAGIKPILKKGACHGLSQTHS
jgi:hypothetical protein